MTAAIVTGSGGLIGSASVRRLAASGFEVVGIDNDMRASLFGPAASTAPVTRALEASVDGFTALDVDVRDEQAMTEVFAPRSGAIGIVVHCASQPSHDWSATDPKADFAINAGGTLNVLEAARRHAPDATFAFCSTNKVYGDGPNRLPLLELESRYELPPCDPLFEGIGTSMSIDGVMRSPYGTSKAAADLAVQEYGLYHGLPTVCFRAGCVTGPDHAGVELHGFLAYLMQCVVTGGHYRVHGYGGKQVRDNLHAADFADAVLAFHSAPKPGSVYNIGGGRQNSLSVLEAIAAAEQIAGRGLGFSRDQQARRGDQRWWITDLSEFQREFPAWRPTIGVLETLQEIHARHAEGWLAAG